MIYYDTSCQRCGRSEITFLEEFTDQILCDDCLEEVAVPERPNNAIPALIVAGMILLTYLLSR